MLLRPSREEAAVPQAQDPVGGSGNRVAVARNQHSAPSPRLLPEEVYHPDLVVAVDLAGRLVGQKDGGMVGDGHGEAGSRGLSAGELSGEGSRSFRDGQPLEELGAVLAVRPAGEPLSELDILLDRQVADQVAALEQETDVAGAERGPAPLAAAGETLVRHPDRAAVRLVEAAEAGDERRLAGTRGARDGDELAPIQVQRDVPKSLDLLVAGVEEPVETAGPQRPHRHPKESVTVFQGSTLSAPAGAETVTMASTPPRQNS